MSDVDGRVHRAVSGITMIAERVTRFSTRLLLAVVVVCAGSFLLGLAALDGGVEEVWIALGAAFGAIAIGAALIARWRIGGVRRHVPAIAAEVRSLLQQGRHDVIEVVDQLHHDPGDVDGARSGSAIVVSQRVIGLRGVARRGLAGTDQLLRAVTAITTFPGLALIAVLVTIVFAMLVPIFLLALAL